MTATIETETFALTVNYSLTLEKMIVAGHYDYVDDNITAKWFVIEGLNTVEFEAAFFHFDRFISSDEAKQLILNAGYEAGKIEQLLSVGAIFGVQGTTHCYDQCEHPIVGLGSSVNIDGRQVVPCLHGSDQHRGLYLARADYEHRSNCRFLGTRKKP